MIAGCPPGSSQRLGETDRLFCPERPELSICSISTVVVLTDLFIVCLFVNTGRAASNHYVESFTTTTFKDAANTTALWDTGTGELKLNPFVGSLVGTYNTTGTATHLAVAGDLVFVADDVSGLQIINITNPALPTLAGTYNTPGTAMGVAVAGDLAFVADGSFGLQIINVTNPAGPTPTGTYNTPGTSFDVAVAGDLAVVADGFNLLTINIANPAAPTAGTYVTTGVALGVAQPAISHSWRTPTPVSRSSISLIQPFRPSRVATTHRDRQWCCSGRGSGIRGGRHVRSPDYQCDESEQSNPRQHLQHAGIRQWSRRGR
jgi:hypothetical protein